MKFNIGDNRFLRKKFGVMLFSRMRVDSGMPVLCVCFVTTNGNAHFAKFWAHRPITDWTQGGGFSLVDSTKSNPPPLWTPQIWRFLTPPPVDSKTDETMLPQVRMKKIYQNVKAQKSLKNCKIQKFPQKFHSFTPRVAKRSSCVKLEIFWKFLNFAIF